MGCSLVAGIFFAAVLTPSFLVVFTGTAAACVLLLATAPFTDQPGTAWRVVGALLG